METNPRGGHEPQQSQLTLQILWFAMVLAVVIYGVVGWVVAGADPPVIRWTEMPVLAVLAVGIVALISAFIIPSVILRNRGDGRSGMRVAPAYNVPARVTQILILRFALLESAAICGLVAAFLGKSVQLYLPLGFLACVGMVLSFPTDALIRRLDSE
jgi:F0F1-type ATP synthase membrane subunit c/vacuolar-type H+-ATPase subunit K